MGRASAAQEPSMEEILASIRKIIESGDDRPAAGAAFRPTPAAKSTEPAPLRAASEPRPAASVTSLAETSAERPVEMRFPPAEAPRAPEQPRPQEDSSDAAAFFDVDFFDLRMELEQEFAGEGRRDPAPVPEAREDTGAAEEFPALEARFEEPGWESGWAPRSDGRHAALRAAATVAVDRRNADGFRRDVRIERLPDTPVQADEAQIRETLRAAAGAGEEAPAASGIFIPANNDEPRMGDYRAAVLQDAAAQPPLAGSLLSERAGGLVGASFEELSRAIREGQMRSMEEMAEDLMRPMLQEWLDDNLPKLVERLVREEIERVARGGR